jgi:hypothetical protein
LARPPVQVTDGEYTRIKVLDNLGGGKLVVDLKGQRVVANTHLSLERNQEVDVTVKKIGDKVILQLGSSMQSNTTIDKTFATPVPKAQLGDIIYRLIACLEDAEAATLGSTQKELLRSVQELLQRILVDAAPPAHAGAAEALSHAQETDLPQQIRDAMEVLGYVHDGKATDAEVIAHSVHISPLQAELMRLRSAFSKDGLLHHPYRGTSEDRNLISALLEAINSVLESTELYHLKSILAPSDPRAHRFRCLCTIPVVMQGQIITAELEFFCPKYALEESEGKDRDDDEASLSIVINIELERLGHMEFTIGAVDKHINCQIKADRYETYELAKEHAEDLERRLAALGYEVAAIRCMKENPERRSSLRKIFEDDIDITV